MYGSGTGRGRGGHGRPADGGWRGTAWHGVVGRAGRGGSLRRALLVPVLLALLVVPTSGTAHAAGLMVQPQEELRDQLTAFSLMVTLPSGLYQVRFNDVVVGELVADPDGGTSFARYTVPAAGAPGAAVCGPNPVTITTPPGPVIGAVPGGAGGGDVHTAAVVDSSSIFGLCPDLAATPTETSGVHQVDYTLTPLGFAPGWVPVGLSVDGAAHPFEVTDTGDARFTESLACGVHQLDLQMQQQSLPSDGGGRRLTASRPVRTWCPTVTVAPGTVTSSALPATVAVRGTGFHPGLPVAVSVDGTPTGTGTVDSDGLVTAPARLADLACGSHEVSLTEQQVPTRVTPLLLTAGAPLTVLCPRLLVAPPETVGVGSVTYTVSPVQFPPDDVVVGLTVDGTPTDTRADGTGNLLFTAALACGPHQVRLVERAGGTHDGPVPDDVGTGSTLVMCPAVTLAPGSVRFAAQPAAVAVRATGFHPGRRVAVRVDGSPATTGSIGTDGAAALPLRVAGLTCGRHTVSVTERPPSAAPLLTATATLAVTNCPPPPAAARVALDPAVLRTGMLTHVTGSGFTAGSPVTLTWRTPDGAALPGDCTTTADPTGRIDTYCPVLPHGVLGARRLHATQGTRTAAADAVVDGGSMQPGVGGDHLVFRR